MFGWGKQLLNEYLDLLLPNVCLVCQKNLGEIVCDECVGCIVINKTISTRVDYCDYVISFSDYKGIMSRFIHYYKLDGFQKIGQILGGYFCNEMSMKHYQNSLFVKVPSNSERIQDRGFDHLDLLYRPLLNYYHRSFENILVRHKPTPPLFGLSKSQRVSVMRDSILPFSEKINLNGQDVILCDDVLTTGTTLSVCAELCRRLGASSVKAVVFSEVYDV